ncbi:hypothetical protein McanMca71_006746 [Microsporum canis]|uniref:AT hook domain-containing protein n=1 Tax=Arthroderma otae (strain ATCC MYA-4605 / CBS 113480) TaxID=554155 RepID=C5FFY1_ARTOC|nr:AT hook domain-containing protein [Microsporum canis CBS 113480]EEQ29666.1 AT hook domain-containing protein [Microsporum canis CBS 113480]
MATAPSREERKQMRLRGAGNHKVKDVNFGFSFGSPTPQSPIPPPRSPPALPQKSPITPQSRHSTTSNKQLSIPSRASSRRSAARASAEKPQDGSIYDIPEDDDDRPEERSAKRRRISRSFESAAPESSPTEHRTSAHPLPPEPKETSKETSKSPSVRHTVSSTRSPAGDTPSLRSIRQSIEFPVSASPSPRVESPGSSIQESSLTLTKPAGHTHNQKQRRRKRKSVVQHPKKKRKSLLKPPVVPESHGGEAEDGPEQLQSPPQDLTHDEELVRSESSRPNGTNVSTEEPIDSPRDLPHPNTDERTDEMSEQAEVKGSGNTPDITAGAHSEGGNSESESHLPTPEAQDVRPKSAPKENSPAMGQDVLPNPVGKREKQNKEDSSPKQKGKTRQRKEKGEGRSTVPVVVHRLANTSALHEWPDEEDSAQSSPADGRQPSPHRPSSHPPQIPSRSGVNAADVLSQICRETLEKTLSTLESAIERESNRTRQVEWTRKRKAVEAFGAELEGRLFEISELLDSNFVLAMRLKKEKKEVFTLRNQLMDLRKEREEIAIRADEVRRRFSADESAKTEHGTINNALHDLQLAVDRSQKNADQSSVGSTNPFVGLEFLLRTVSQDVCSSVSDFHGGLLNQVKSFNDQLQRTAALLDRRES